MATDEDDDLCIICLEPPSDRTIVGECGHNLFCFGCLTTWAQKSRKCPLCSTKMAPFVLHHLDEQTGPLKFHLPPLPSSPRLLAAASPTANIISQTAVRPSSTSQTTTDLWAQVRSRQAVDDADELERQVENRRQIYRRRWFVKHTGVNIHSRYKALPPPRQFASHPDLVTRATLWLRRELRVWPDLDVQFLTTYIISIMRSLELRSTATIRLLGDFLDHSSHISNEPSGSSSSTSSCPSTTEHFIHEFAVFLSSPYRDLTMYDATAQYGPIYALEDTTIDTRPRLSSIKPSTHRRRSRSISSSDSYDSLDSIESYEPQRRPRPAPSSPRKWNVADTYVPLDLQQQRQQHPPRRRRARSPRDPHRKTCTANASRARTSLRATEIQPPPPSKALEQETQHAKMARGMRAWDDTRPDDPMVDRTLEPRTETNDATTNGAAHQSSPSMALRIFGASGQAVSMNGKVTSTDRQQSESVAPGDSRQTKDNVPVTTNTTVPGTTTATPFDASQARATALREKLLRAKLEKSVLNRRRTKPETAS